MSGLFAHGTGSLVVLDGENENEVDALFASDPFVVHIFYLIGMPLLYPFDEARQVEKDPCQIA